MTVDNLLLKLKKYDKNYLVCLAKNPLCFYFTSNVLIRLDNNTIILEPSSERKTAFNIRQLAKYLLECHSNAVVTFKIGSQYNYVKSMSPWRKYLILYTN